MSYKDGGAKQSQDYRDGFDHLMHPATLLLRVVGDPGFRMASSGPENVLIRPARQKPPIRRIQYLFRGRGASVPHSHRWRRSEARRLNPAGFSFALAGRDDLLALPFRPLLS
jgi:hypothetical protein